MVESVAPAASPTFHDDEQHQRATRGMTALVVGLCLPIVLAAVRTQIDDELTWFALQFTGRASTAVGVWLFASLTPAPRLLRAFGIAYLLSFLVAFGVDVPMQFRLQNGIVLQGSVFVVVDIAFFAALSWTLAAVLKPTHAQLATWLPRVVVATMVVWQILVWGREPYGPYFRTWEMMVESFRAKNDHTNVDAASVLRWQFRNATRLFCIFTPSLLCIGATVLAMREHARRRAH
jgi:hypothetical protein